MFFITNDILLTVSNHPYLFMEYDMCDDTLWGLDLSVKGAARLGILRAMQTHVLCERGHNEIPLSTADCSQCRIVLTAYVLYFESVIYHMDGDQHELLLVNRGGKTGELWH